MKNKTENELKEASEEQHIKFSNFSLHYTGKSDIQIWFSGSHVIHADKIAFSSHGIFDMHRFGKYTGYLLIRDKNEERKLKDFLKKMEAKNEHRGI